MKYIDFDKTAAYRELQQTAAPYRQYDFRGLLDARRVERYRTPMAGGLVYSWAAKAVDDGVITLLQALADEQELIPKYRALLDGELMNTGENRKVLHHLLRGADGRAATG
ncbi:MAG: glucose-6-phosphate isomerase, partial [Treponema sp.]|nr:glucose-6-phosphate isomerase [Treponema sp.]